MDITELINNLSGNYSFDNPLLYVEISKKIVSDSALGILLQSKSTLEERLTQIEDAIENQPTLKRREAHKEEENFSRLLAHQQQLLDCPTEDEHVLLLACLKQLEELGYQANYAEVVKEILLKQLHKISVAPLSFTFVGRKKETEDALRILRRTTRNSLIIVGKGGVGKTTLAKHIIESTDKKFYQLSPGHTSFFDSVIGLQAASTQLPSFFLDELFAFEAEQIKYLLDNSQLIATANDSSYRKFSADHPDLVSKLEVLQLDELSEADTKTIITHQAEQLRFQEENPPEITSEVLAEIYSLAKQYMPENAFPAKGIALLEEVVLFAKSQGAQQISIDQLRAVVSQKTNIPISNLTDFDKKDLSTLPDRLRTKVKGQDETIDKIARVIQRSRLGFGKKNRPIGSFLFVGPSGVGKTELAKALAHELFGDSENMVRLDMSEFGEAHNAQRLIGAPPGYIGFEEGGQLTNPIKAKPYNLILLDEIEKAHPRVFDIFLQVLDDGRLTDGQGKLVDFRNTVIIATSNAGIEDILDLIEEGKTQEEISREVKEILTDYFRIEFINRFDDITIFNALKPEALIEIAKLQLEKLSLELSKRQIGFSVSDETLERIAQESYDPRYGARGLLRYLQEKIENTLAEMIIGGSLKEGQSITF
ncbi:MAG TPA: ATP-dependent Clp protease ATP-binding subunit [Patescibacteria group bacterium]|nr:ATP-dependent Clp protease ATP-binding subunit [Patescibacteria group bacterium]